MGIAEMHLDERKPRPGQGIAQGDAGVGEGGRIEQDEARAGALGLPHFSDQRGLFLALKGEEFVTSGRGQHPKLRLDRGEIAQPVELGLAFAESGEIGTVEDEDAGHGNVPESAAIMQPMRRMRA